MKKIFLIFAVLGAFVACDPVQEDISNGGHISIDELKAKTTVTVDKAASGANGNVVTCQTSAPVNAKWMIGDKEFIGNYAWKKMKIGEYTVVLTALCPDGTELTAEYAVSCQEITNELEKIYIYGDPANGQEPAVLGPGDAAAGRFSDGEGKYFPFLSDDVYFGKKTLIFDIIAAEEGPFIWGSDVGCTCRIMSGWWDGPFADNVPLSVGLWELPITDDIANTCAKGATAHDLDIMMTRGSVTIKSVYYEE
ncbi:MAG: hypothetical protein J5552_10600 [Prevotella sp.]|nr:hypothetical protein [Prevotella sp.]